MKHKPQSAPKPSHAINQAALREVTAGNGSCLDPIGQPHVDSGAGVNPLGGG
jgi:hypothetical protein